MKLFIKYCRDHLKAAGTVLLVLLIFGVTALLYRLPAEYFLYASLLSLISCLLIFLIGFRTTKMRIRALDEVLRNADLAEQELPKSENSIEDRYQQIIKTIGKMKSDEHILAEEERRDRNDFYTLWTHQMKTPIAAMHLLLQESVTSGEDSLTDEEEFRRSRQEMDTQLLKIEDYTQMVLTYQRLGSESSDFVFRRMDLDPLIRECIRKYTPIFIRRGISLTFEKTNLTVLSDEKWLSFEIGQLLSNALKYTNREGKIRIFSRDRTLIISDDGIGIRREDLPRVFEKGFTGQNGRDVKSATGLGLWLCREIARRLGNEIRIESTVGKGTDVMLYFPENQQLYE